MSKHTIPTELNIAPRGKSWLNGQLIDGVHGYPTRQSMENAEHAAFEKWARFFGTWVVERDDDPNFSITGYTDITVNVAWLAWQARAALAATAAGSAVQCTCPSGDGSLQWPCPAHPPTASTLAAPAGVAEPAPITFMTEDRAREWAWDKVREELGTQSWTAGESFNFHGFYLWGWNYRAQYELQRTATRAAVMQEILSAAPAAAAPVLDLESLTMPKNPHSAAGDPDRHIAWAQGAGAVFATVEAAFADAPAAAAPVVLPEPVAYSLGLAKYAHSSNIIAANEFTPDSEHADEWENLYTEQQVRDLLATATGLPAQAVETTHADFEAWWGAAGDGRSKLLAKRAWTAATRAAAPQAQADARDADGMYYLQDARHSAMVGNCPSFWRPGGNGYTTNLDEAERFTFEDAMKQHRCRETDLPWLCSEVDKLRRPTVDCQYMPRCWDAQRESIAAIAAAKGE